MKKNTQKKVKRANYYMDGDEWFVDRVPVTSKQRILSTTFIGLGERYVFRYKNQNEQYRWKLVDIISPNAEVWFILAITIEHSIYDNYKIAVSIVGDELHYEWLSETMRISNSKVFPNKLSILETALIESSIEKSLSE